MNNGPNGQVHEPRRLMDIFYVFLCLCREVSFLKSWFKFLWLDFQSWRHTIFKIGEFETTN